MRLLRWTMMIFALTVATVALRQAAACPFCTAQALTLTEEIKAADVALVVTLEKIPEANAQPSDATAPLEPCTFTIDHAIKGGDKLGADKVVKTLYLGQATKGTKFFLTAIAGESGKFAWSAPTQLPEGGAAYIDALLKLPEKGNERVAFFQKNLKSSEELLSRDAYDEIAKIPYAQLREAKGELHHDEIVAAIKDPETKASYRRMYLSLLSVCGTKDDVPLVESLIRSEDRRDRSSLDSTLNCYMSLKGAEAMPLIEELFLKNPKIDYVDRYSAIMAIRFQGTEGKAVERPRLIEALRYNLDHPKVADLVVMDLARWADWSVMDRLVDMFKKSNEDTIFVREPIINYLRICPKPEAKKHLEELAKIDPEAYTRALSLMPLPMQPPTTGAAPAATATVPAATAPAAPAATTPPAATAPATTTPPANVGADAAPPSTPVQATSLAVAEAAVPPLAPPPSVSEAADRANAAEQGAAVAPASPAKSALAPPVAVVRTPPPTATPGTLAVAAFIVAASVIGAVYTVRRNPGRRG